MPNDKKQPMPGPFFELFTEVGILHQLSRAFFEARLSDGMILPHFSVLNHLARVGEGCTPLQIARAFQVPKNSMTHTLAWLEERELIETRPHETDKRSKTIWLTEAGRVFRNEAIARVSQDMMDVLPEMSTRQVEQTLGSLKALRERLDRARD